MKSRFRIKDHGDDDGPSTRGLLFCAQEEAPGKTSEPPTGISVRSLRFR